MNNDDYSARLPYLEEARNLIFEEYNLAKFIEKWEPEIFANIENNQIERRYLESLLKTDASQKSLKRRIWDTSRKVSQKLGFYEALRPLAKFTKREYNLMNADQIRTIDESQALILSKNRQPILLATRPYFSNWRMKRQAKRGACVMENQHQDDALQTVGL